MLMAKKATPPCTGSLPAEESRIAKVLVYSPTKQGCLALSRMHTNVNSDVTETSDWNEAKKLLKTGGFKFLMIDISSANGKGKKYLDDARILFDRRDLTSFGIDIATPPDMSYSKYSPRCDRVFTLQRQDNERMTGVMNFLHINCGHLKWVKAVLKQLKSARVHFLRDKDLKRPVLITGPEGAGKISLLQITHQLFGRGDNPFVVADCSPRQTSMTTDTSPKQMKVVRNSFGNMMVNANGGTFFVRSLSKLLSDDQGVLADLIREWNGIDEHTGKTVPFKGRIVISDSADLNILKRECNKKIFDLDPIIVQIPSIADYPEEIPEIVKAAIAYMCFNDKADLLEIDPLAMDAIVNKGANGNLRNIIDGVRSGVKNAINGKISPANLDFPSCENLITERDMLYIAYQGCDGNQKKMAEFIGVKSVDTVRNRMKKYGIPLKKEQKLKAQQAQQSQQSQQPQQKENETDSDNG